MRNIQFILKLFILTGSVSLSLNAHALIINNLIPSWMNNLLQRPVNAVNPNRQLILNSTNFYPATIRGVANTVMKIIAYP